MKTQPPLRPYTPPARALKRPEKPSLAHRARQVIGDFLWGCLRWSVRLSVMSLLLICCSLGGAYAALSQNFARLPDVSSLAYYAPIEATEILDASGKLLYKVYGEENRKVVPLQAIPDLVQKAVISAEDGRFYEHQGIDPVGLVRAFKANFDTGNTVQGGSTITQQVVKNMYLTPERTFQRKFAEMWLAYEVEQRFSKAQILELYLNQIYWGHNAYGIEAASQNYFGKSVSSLNLAEGALLAGILTGPEIYSPYRSPKAARTRQHLTLDRMVAVGFISAEQAKQAKAVALTYPGIKAGTMKYPYFTSYVLAVLKQNYGESDALQRGLRVYTTLNGDWQTQGEKLLNQHIRRHRGARISQAALVAIDNKTGFVRAIVGGTGFKASQFNRAWQAHRQPGSAFKPFVYLTAFSHGYKPAHLEVDEPIQYRQGSTLWKPRNYGGGHAGPMTLQRALEQSNNIIAVKLGERIGNGNVIDTAHKLGIRSSLRNVLSLALGPNEVTPLEMATAYSTLSRGCSYLEPTPILRIEDRFGEVIEDNSQRQAEPVCSQEASGALVQVMKGVIQRGTAPEARIGRPAAGKTGTTSDHKDAWFVGFTPQVTTAVWVGNDKPLPMYGYATGGHLSAPLWAAFMRYTHRKLPVQDFAFGKGMLPLLAGIPMSRPDDESGYLPQYERLGARKAAADLRDSVDPFLVNPAELSPANTASLPLELPSSAQLQANPAQILPGEPGPAAPAPARDNAPIVQELDQLIQELDRLEIPVNPE
ncbi:MAG: transglycosylase domain-containing protein [Candidatus Sericytochromatia bacterium]